MALNQGRNTPERSADFLVLPVKAGAVIYEGSLVAIKAGYAVPGKVDTTIISVGRAEEFIDNTTGVDGDKIIKVKRGCFKFENDGTIKQEHVLQDCYIVDDETVGATDDTGKRAKAGKVIEIEPDGVWVLIR